MTTKATLSVTAVACLIVGAIGGYSISKITPNRSNFNRQVGQMANGQRGQLSGGGRVMGEIQSITDGRMTIKTQNNSSQIIITSGDTKYQKMTNGSASDVVVGSQVQISGTKNSDGSTTATSIQIVPEGVNPMGNRGTTGNIPGPINENIK